MLSFRPHRSAKLKASGSDFNQSHKRDRHRPIPSSPEPHLSPFFYPTIFHLPPLHSLILSYLACWSSLYYPITVMMRKSSTATHPSERASSLSRRDTVRPSSRQSKSAGIKKDRKTKKDDKTKIREAKILRMEQEQMLEDDIAVRLIQVRFYHVLFSLSTLICTFSGIGPTEYYALRRCTNRISRPGWVEVGTIATAISQTGLSATSGFVCMSLTPCRSFLDGFARLVVSPQRFRFESSPRNAASEP